MLTKAYEMEIASVDSVSDRQRPDAKTL